VGQLIRAALDVGCRRLIVGIGGSATNDGGAGMAQHLGVRFFNERGEITRPLTGADLITLTAIDHTAIDHRLAGTRIDVACDVTNPLTGERGAAATYGPQKGATPAIVRELDAGLRHLASLLPDIDPDQPGMGAAGGLGFGLTAFCGAKLRRGIEIVLDAVGFDDRVQRADLVLTGEGRLDGQSVQGKTCMGVVEAAAKREVPTVALVGSTGEGADLALRRGLSAYHTLVELAGSKHLAMRDAARLLEQLTAQIIPRYL
jgi:glycerate kinase